MQLATCNMQHARCCWVRTAEEMHEVLKIKTRLTADAIESLTALWLQHVLPHCAEGVSTRSTLSSSPSVRRCHCRPPGVLV
jgi:hypothetical protein